MGFYNRVKTDYYERKHNPVVRNKASPTAYSARVVEFPDDAEPITEFPEYRITPQGNIYNSRGNIIAQSVDTKGYLKVALYKGNQRYTRRVHVLVAQQFIPTPDNLGDHPVVDHIDQDRTHCSVDNLQWVSQADNIKKAYEQGRVQSTAMRVKCIEDDKEFFSCTQASEYYHCSKITIQDAIRKRNGYVKSLNKHFEFVTQ